MRGGADARAKRVRVFVCVVAVALSAATGLGAQATTAEGRETDAGPDPVERWCAPPTSRSAEPESVRAAAEYGGTVVVAFERDAGRDASLCLSRRERLQLLARQAADPLFYGEVVLGASWGQWHRQPVAWERD